MTGAKNVLATVVARIPRWPYAARSIGLVLDADAVHGVYLRGNTVVWRRTEQLHGGEIAAGVERVLSGDAEHGGFSGLVRPVAVALVASDRAQVKALRGLPHARSSELDGIVRTGVARYFRRNGVPLVTGRTYRERDVVWASAIEMPCIEAIEAGCQAAGVRLALVRPVTGPRDEGTSAAEAGTPDGAFAHALRAARGRHERRLAVPVRGVRSTRFPNAIRGILLSTALAGWLVAATLPQVRAKAHLRRLNRWLDSTEKAAEKAADVDRHLQHARAVYGELTAFDARRGAATAALARVTRALPAGAALLSFRSDTAGLTLVLVAPDPGRAIDALDVGGLGPAQVLGPITRENVSLGSVADFSGPQVLERVTLRYPVESARTAP